MIGIKPTIFVVNSFHIITQLIFKCKKKLKFFPGQAQLLLNMRFPAHSMSIFSNPFSWTELRKEEYNVSTCL